MAKKGKQKKVLQEIANSLSELTTTMKHIETMCAAVVDALFEETPEEDGDIDYSYENSIGVGSEFDGDPLPPTDTTIMDVIEERKRMMGNPEEVPVQPVENSNEEEV